MVIADVVIFDEYYDALKQCCLEPGVGGAIPALLQIRDKKCVLFAAHHSLGFSSFLQQFYRGSIREISEKSYN